MPDGSGGDVVATLPNNGPGRLQLHAAGVSSIHIVPGASVDTTLTASAGVALAAARIRDADGGYKVAAVAAGTSGENAIVSAVLPYRSDVTIVADRKTRVVVEEHLEGSLAARGGSCFVKKLQGLTVKLDFEDEVTFVKSAEAVEVDIEAKSLTVKRMQGGSARLKVDQGLTASALYFDLTEIDVATVEKNRGNINLNGVHGKLCIRGNADVIVLGLNGCLNCEIGNGNVHAQFDQLFHGPSSVQVGHGDVHLSLPNDQSVRFLKHGKGRLHFKDESQLTMDSDLDESEGTPEFAKYLICENDASKFSKDELLAMTRHEAATRRIDVEFDEDDDQDEYSIRTLAVDACGEVNVDKVGWKERIRKRFLGSDSPS